MTQQTIADLFVVTKVTQIKYELGTALPNASHLALLAAEGGDVFYILSGLPTSEVRQIYKDTVVLESEKRVLLDNYCAVTLSGQAAIRQAGVRLRNQPPSGGRALKEETWWRQAFCESSALISFATGMLRDNKATPWTRVYGRARRQLFFENSNGHKN